MNMEIEEGGFGQIPGFARFEQASKWQLIRAADCASLLRVTPATWYDWVKYDPTAPQPVLKAGTGKTAPSFWLLSDVEAYIELLIREQRTGYIAEAHKKDRKEKEK